MKTVEKVTLDNTSMYYRNDSHDRAIIKEIWESGVYSHKFPFGEKAVVLDIGAHNGYFSLFAARNSASGSRIYAFEPVLENYELLTRNLEINGIVNIFAYNVCVSDSDGTLTMFHNSANTGGHSTYRERVEKYNLDTIEEISCPSVALTHTVPLDVTVIDFCKMDCEGAEFDILLKSPEDFLKRIKVFAIEFHEFGGHKVGELIELFTRLDYDVTHEFSPSKMGISFGNLCATRK